MKILYFFIINPTIEIYQKDLQFKVRLAKATLIKWLNFLTKENILKFKEFGRSKVFHLNKKNVAIKYLKILNTILNLKDLEKLSEKYNIKFYLYGSCARGEDVENSDIDLLVIGRIYKEELFPYIEKIAKKIKRKIKMQIFSESEWYRLSKKDKAFYERVEKDKVLI